MSEPVAPQDPPQILLVEGPLVASYLHVVGLTYR